MAPGNHPIARDKNAVLDRVAGCRRERDQGVAGRAETRRDRFYRSRPWLAAPQAKASLGSRKSR